MTVLLNVVMPVLLVALIVALAQRVLALEVRSLSRATFYLFSPALVLTSLAHASLSGGDVLRLALIPFIATPLLWAAGAVCARLLRLEGTQRSAFHLATLIGNTGNYGLPVALFAFGEEGLARATVYFAVSSLLQSSLGVYLAASGQTSSLAALRAMAGVPMAYAALVGLLLNLGGIGLPEWLDKSLTLLAGGAVPVMLAILGIQLASMVSGRHSAERTARLPLVLSGALRLGLSPLLVWLLAPLLGLDTLSRDSAIVQAAMPTAVMTIIMATEYGSDPRFITAAVFLSTIASLFTVTAILLLLGV